MTAGTYNFTIEQGSTFKRTLALKTTADAPFDLSDVTEVRAQMRRAFNSSTKVDFVCAVGEDPTEGKIDFEMDAETTAAISITQGLEWKYDVEIEFSDGTIQRIMQGTVTVSPEVTK